MTRAKTEQEKPLFSVRSLTLSPDTDKALELLSGDATDYTGRKVSGSAVVRALLRYANTQGYEWGIANLCPLIEQEFSSGITWGRKGKLISQATEVGERKKNGRTG